MLAVLFTAPMRTAHLRVALLASAVLAATVLSTVGSAETDPTPANFTVAFIGDSGSNSNSLAVLNLIKNEGADAVVHNGDFDYDDNPAGFENQINLLGADFPYFASKGNHDDVAWNGYRSLFEARMNRIGIPWIGELGSMSSFEYMGIRFLLTAPAIDGGDFAGFIRDELA